jgi:alpha-tubulin suppressor-like RCC1 family protein
MNLQTTFSSTAKNCFFVDEEDNLYAFGTDTAQAHPSKLELPEATPQRVKMVGLGEHHFIVLTQEGQVYGGGGGSLRDLKARGPLNLPDKAVYIACGVDSTGIVLRDGSLYLSKYFVPPPGLKKLEGIPEPVHRVALGASHSLALTREGRVYAWGDNKDGKLGLGDRQRRTIPALVEDLPPASKIFCGSNHSFALVGTYLYGWGSNQNGNFPSLPHSHFLLTPTRLLKGVLDLACGSSHVLAFREDFSVLVWGFNQYGQLGLGDAKDRLAPAVFTLPCPSPIVSLIAGVYQVRTEEGWREERWREGGEKGEGGRGRETGEGRKGTERREGRR